MESSVISEHTAFIAYDADQSKPIEGALQVWDLAAEEKTIYRRSRVKQTARRSTGGKAPRAKLSTMAIPKSAKHGNFVSPPQAKRRARYSRSTAGVGVDHAEIVCAVSLSAVEFPPQGVAMTTRYSRSAAGGDLAEIVSLQQAAGYWSLSAVAEKIVKKKDAQRPPQGVPADVWATVLVLAFLEIHCAGQKDEWELIAMKAKSWVASQTLSGVSLDSLQEKARKIITG